MIRFLYSCAILLTLSAAVAVADDKPLISGHITVFDSRIEVSPAAMSTETLPATYNFIRCFFSEKRLVIKHKEQIFVLHEGDVLPESDIRIVRVEKDRAILVAGGIQENQRSPKNLILVSENEGKIKVQVLPATNVSTLSKKIPMPAVPESHTKTIEKGEKQ